MALKALETLRLAAPVLALAGLAAAGLARADDTPAAPAPAATAAASATRPERGAHMEAVEKQYGAPTTRYPAVGQPPITRWDYPNMVVYFEGDRVIHTVLVAPAAG